MAAVNLKPIPNSRGLLPWEFTLNHITCAENWAKVRNQFQVYNILDYGASPTLADNASAINKAIQAASDAGGGLVVIPKGDFRVNSAIRMKTYVSVEAYPQGRLIPGTNGMDVFDAVGTSATEHVTLFGISIVNTLAKTGVIGVNANQCRHSVIFDSLYFESIDIGLKAHNLCWQTTTRECYALACRLGFEVTNSSHNYRFDRCYALQCTDSGFYAHAEATDIEPILFKTEFNDCLSQGHDNYGFKLVTCGHASINGGYAEANDLADVYAYGCQFLHTDALYGGSNFGQTHIRLRNCDGANLDNVVCAGVRTGAPTDPGYPNTSWTFDVDSSNVYCQGFLLRGASNNLISGVVTGLKLQENINGNTRLGSVGASGNNIKGVINTSSDSTRHYHLLANNRNEKNDVTSTFTIDCRTAYDVWRRGVRGGEAFTFTNPEDGQFIYLILRGTSDMGNRPPDITVGGYKINMAGAAADKNTIIGMEYDTDYGWIVKSDSGWDQFGSQALDAEGLRIRSTSAVPPSGTWKKGDLSHNSAISTTNGIHGWKCTQSGTFGTFAATGQATNGSAVLTSVSNFNNLHRGDFITISSGFPASTYAQVLTFDSTAGTITLDTAATSTPGAASNLAHTAPLFERFGTKLEVDDAVSRSDSGTVIRKTENTGSGGSKNHIITTGDGGGNPWLHLEVPSVQGSSYGIDNAKTGNPTVEARAGVLTSGIISETYDAASGGKFWKVRVQYSAGAASIASANDLTLRTDGNHFQITGTANINGIASANWQSGALISLEFTGAAVIKHNTAASAGFLSIITKTAADVTMAADKVIQLRMNSAGTKWLEV